MAHDVPKLPPPYPLAWPEGWARTEPRLRKQSRYRMTMHTAATTLVHEIDNWSRVVWLPSRSPNATRRSDRGTRAVVITSNLKGRTYADGRPFASTKVREPEGDPGVAVWWLERGPWQGGADGGDFERLLRVVACDTWSSVAANLRACGVVIESLRAIERAEATEALKRAEWGFSALRLPTASGAGTSGTYATAEAAPPPWWAVRLALDPPYTEAAIMRAWRQCVVREHPDRGGSHEAFLELERARDEALAHARAEARRTG